MDHTAYREYLVIGIGEERLKAFEKEVAEKCRRKPGTKSNNSAVTLKELVQDANKELSKWLSNRVDSRYQARSAAIEIERNKCG